MSAKVYNNPYRADYVIERAPGRLPLYNIKINIHSASDLFTAEFGPGKSYPGSGIYIIGWFRYGRNRAFKKAEKELARYVRNRAALDEKLASKPRPTEVFSLTTENRSF